MSAVQRYATAAAFRAALHDRLRQSASGKSETWLVRRRKFLVFDRILARLMVVAPDRWLLKGAVALDFRLGTRARPTVDLDLHRSESEDAATADLRAAQSLDLGDYFTFEIERTTRLDRLVDGQAVRYRVTAFLEGRRFEYVTLDVGFDQEIVGKPDLLPGPNFFAFAGIPPVVVPTIPLEQHVAEKLHAYTRINSDDRQSSRVKDLIDLALIAQNCEFEADRLRNAISVTFTSRDRQPVPNALPAPPTDWRMPYRALAIDTGLDPDINRGHATAARLLDPILGPTLADDARWSLQTGGWEIS